MPKKTGNLWKEICDWDNLYHAYKATIKGRRYKPALIRYSASLDQNLVKLHDALVSLTWQPHITFTKRIQYPKPRIITAPVPYDRVAFHAIIDVIRPYFERKYIEHSYACIAGKGTLHAVQAVQKMVYRVNRQCGGGYVLKCDIHSYFASIDHNILKNLIRKTIKDPNVLLMLDRIIDSAEGNVGLPLGALSSQLFANVYLDYLDHKIKEEYGVRNYARYMDDFVIVHEDKKYLAWLLKEINRIVEEDLHLQLNPKTAIFPIKHGVDFCGYRIWPTYPKARKRNIKNARRRLKYLAAKVNAGEESLDKFKRTLASFQGLMSHCKSYKTMEKILDECAITYHDENQISLDEMETDW